MFAQGVRCVSAASGANGARRACSNIGRRTQGPVGIITLDRPAKLNALTLQMIRDLHRIYDEWLAEGSPIKCIVMEGAGGKAFCAGGDVVAVQEAALAGKSLPYDFFYEEYQLNHRIATMWEKKRVPHIALWDGITMGGGVGLSAHGKFRIATERTLWAKPETAIGLFPDVGSTHLLSRIKGGLPMGLYIGLTGVRLRAADLMRTGLATHYVPSSNLPQLVPALEALGEEAGDESSVAAALAGIGESGSPDARYIPSQDQKVNLQASAAVLRHEHALVARVCFSAGTAEELFHRLEEEASSHGGKSDAARFARRTLETLQRMSPTAIKVTMEACRRHAAADCTIGDALRTEYRLSQRATLQQQPLSDFHEGVRAVLIDKDPSSAVWDPPSLRQVSSAAVETYFAPLGPDHPRGELVLAD